ncbi:MAG: DUF4272 domain-containing protein [Verrucomicrobia bacterium]|nr:DUF4272 domain-containing protein [Verrucomicrobiota bacterium]
MPSKKQNPRPTAADVARRTVILKQVIAWSMVAPTRDVLREIIAQWGGSENDDFEQRCETMRDQFWQGLRETGLWEYMSTSEKKFSESTIITMTEQQHIDASWRLESVHVMLWALGMIPQLLDFDTEASPELLELIPSDDPTTFIESAQLRPPEDIDRAREIAEFWHWRSRTRELMERGATFPDDPQLRAAGLCSFDDVVRLAAVNGAQAGLISSCIEDDFPAKGKAYRNLTDAEWNEVASIAAERHFALNWLCGYAPGNNWDDTPTDT